MYSELNLLAKVLGEKDEDSDEGGEECERGKYINADVHSMISVSHSSHLYKRHRLVKMQISRASAWTIYVNAVVYVVIVANLFGTVQGSDGSIKLSDYSRYDDSPINSYKSEYANVEADVDNSESANNLVKKRRYDGAQVWRILVEDDKQKQAIQEMEERFGEESFL